MKERRKNNLIGETSSFHPYEALSSLTLHCRQSKSPLITRPITRINFCSQCSLTNHSIFPQSTLVNYCHRLLSTLASQLSLHPMKFFRSLPRNLAISILFEKFTSITFFPRMTLPFLSSTHKPISSFTRQPRQNVLGVSRARDHFSATS